MSEPQTSDLLNQVVLGRYRIVRQLARGGMGAVYLGRTEGAEGFARPVVIKRILPWLTEDRGVAEMFVREARILSNMQHPNIVSVLDFGQRGDGSYLMVLDYVHGYDLSEWQEYATTERSGIPVDYALHIACKVLDALHYAHSLKRADGKPLGIVHRDVTPTNVFLGDQGVVKLLDFGIALVVDEERKFTGRNEVRGKLPYLPAEVVSGAPPTVASDIYAAGVTLYELLTGINPFDGKQPNEIIFKVLTFDVPAVSSLRQDVPAELDAVVARALDRDLDKRYKTAAEFARALRALASRSDDIIAEELAQQLQHDFADMPAKLGVVSLAQREQAWRSTSQRTAAANSGAPAHAAQPRDRAGAATALGEGERAALSQPAQSRDRVDAASGGERAVPAQPPQARDRAGAATAGTRDAGATPSQRSRNAASVSTSRMLLVAAVSGLAAALVVLVAWFALDREPVQERMVVIAKESALPQQALARLPAAAPDPQTTEPTPVAPASVEQEPSAVERSAHAAKPTPTRSSSPTRPSAPDAQTLSSTFAGKQRLVQACFSKHAKSQESLPPLTLHFQVAATGLVESAKIQPASLSEQPLGRCLIDVAKGTRFGALAKRVSFHIPITTEKIARPGP